MIALKISCNETVITYSKGYCWYYWEHYKNGPSFDFLEARFNKQLDGYTEQQLYVAKKYSCYKEELLQHFSYNKYKQYIFNKAIKYMSSRVAKDIKGKKLKNAELMGIWAGKPITTEHLMSVIAYCDMDAYSTKFSGTFRKLKPEETFQSVKHRNREYWWQSKLLKELVCCYGSIGYIDKEVFRKYVYNIPKALESEIERRNAEAEFGPLCMYYSICISFLSKRMMIDDKILE